MVSRGSENSGRGREWVRLGTVGKRKVVMGFWRSRERDERKGESRVLEIGNCSRGLRRNSIVLISR